MSKFGWACCTIMFIVFSVNMTITACLINTVSFNRDRSIEVRVVGENATINSYPSMSSENTKAIKNIEQALGITR